MYHCLLEVLAVIGSVHFVGSRLVEVEVVVGGHDAEGLLLLSTSALYQLQVGSAKDSKVTFYLPKWKFDAWKHGEHMTSYHHACRLSDLIINVEVSFAVILAHHPRLLQQKVGDFAPVGFSPPAELNLKVFPLSDA